jgi:hypothetical protein
MGTPPRMPAMYFAAGHVLRRGLAQLVDPGGRRVPMLAALDRADRGLLHMVRRREVRLADAEADDVLALAREGVHFGKHDEGVFGTEGAGAAADFGHRGRIMPSHAG